MRLVGGFSLAALFLVGSGWFVTGPFREYPAAFDSAIRNTMRQIQSPMWTSLFLSVTKLGSTLYLWIIGSAAGVTFIILRWFRPLILLIIVMAGQALLHHGGKWFFARPRPANLINYRNAESFSFPSGHAIAAVCLFSAIAWLVATRVESAAAKAGIGIITFVVVFLVGMSRVYIGIHYATDVLAGLLAGGIWVGAVMSIDRRDI